jgi:S1-C subfamily serine protease
MARDRGLLLLRPLVRWAGLLAVVLLLATPARADPRAVVEAVLGLRAEVPAEARTSDTLGTERLGSGVLIDGQGLVLTIGYLILEASAVDLYDAEGTRIPAEVVGYDHDTGLGLVRARAPLKARPVPLGRSADVRIGDPLLVISRAGALGGRETKLADRRDYAGYWEYLLENALLTTPAHPAFGGAALIDTEGRLVGIGSLGINDAAAAGVASPGNMFVPVDALKPIMADLLAFGKRDGAHRPWLGVYAREVGGHVVVTGVAEDGPAAAAGLEAGDLVLGVGGQPVASLAEFYRRIWSVGDAGVQVPLQVTRGPRPLNLRVTSMDRLRWLKLNQSY